jgi:hypothetical protein
MLTEVPLFGIGLHGKSPDVTANKLINAYYEFQQEKDGTRVAVYGTPGLSVFTDQGETPWRGVHTFPPTGNAYGVHRDTFYEIRGDGITTAHGAIGTSEGRVDIDDDGTRIIVVDGDETYVYDTSAPATPIAAVTDIDRPTSPNTCMVQAGRVLTDEGGTGQFKGSGVYTPTSWAALDYATAESSPDHLVRVVNYHGQPVLMGTRTIEYWQNVGGAGFPYALVPNATQQSGLAARWSVGNFMGTVAFLAQSNSGQVFVAILEGFNVKRISTFELDHVINGYVQNGSATGFGYMLGGHSMYQLNFPNAGKSWLYDGSTRYWSELRYGTDGRHRAEMALDINGTLYVSDYSNGKIYRMGNYYTDNGDEIITVLRGRHIAKQKKNLRVASLEIGIEPATTTDQTADPVAALRISKDGGHTFGTQTFAKLGKVGEYLTRCIWRRLGIGRDFVPEITISEPIRKVITDAVLRIDEGTS